MTNWHLRDIIDLEYFFYRDAESLSAEAQQFLHERDRNIYLNSVKPGLKNGKEKDGPSLIKSWLEWRRKEIAAEDAVLPGESFESLFGSLHLLFMLAGLAFGGGMGLSFLSYTGDRPVNVFVYLSVFVILQILLLLVLLVLAIFRGRTGSFLSASPMYRLISRFMLRILAGAKDRVSEKLGAEPRSSMEAILGIVQQKGRVYGSLLFLPIFIINQLFCVGFNMGVLAATIFKVITADIAFGWQSTLQLSPTAIYSLVQKIALPWSWIVAEEIAFPTLAQIEGSRIILKEGIFHMSTPALASWWTFLCFSVLFYGLLPRLFLFLMAYLAQRRQLAILEFRHGEYEQVLLRMTTPMVTTHGRKVGGADTMFKEPEPDYGRKVQTDAGLTGIGKKLVVLIPKDVFAASTQEEIESAVQRKYGSAVVEIVAIDEEYESDTEILADLKDREGLAEIGILIIQEAWQPPILEYINFIKQLRQAIGPSPCIRIGLIGKPQPDTIFSPVQDQNRKIWTRTINAIGDPCIFTASMVNNAT